MSAFNFTNLMSQANQVLAVIGQAKALYDHLKANLEQGKDTLTEADQATLKAKLEEVHAANMALSQELDANLAILEQRGG